MDGSPLKVFSPNHNFPLVLGSKPAIRGSFWQAISTARAKALNKAFQVKTASAFIRKPLKEFSRQAEPEARGHILVFLRASDLRMRPGA
jgi:hypothetical protein